MENLTHSLVGIAASKAGLEKLSPATTPLCFLAANAPDADIITIFFGDRWTYLHHHRGITHSLVGTLALALLLPLFFYAGDKVISRLRRKDPQVKLTGLLIASLVVSATHPFMDWTNNYGIRPFLPWNTRWFYGDLVFIVDPFIWFFVGGAVFLLTSKSKKQIAFWIFLTAAISYIVFFAVGNRPGVSNLTFVRTLWIVEVVFLLVLFTLKAGQRWREKIAITGFVALFVYWGFLAVIHRWALTEARAQGTTISQTYAEEVTDVAAMPTLANPLHWQAVVETERAAYRFEVFLLRDGQTRMNDLIRHERPEAYNSLAVRQALETRPARVFMEFARFPVTRLIGEDCASQTLVQLADLRYTEPGNQRGTFGLSIPIECPVGVPEKAP